MSDMKKKIITRTNPKTGQKVKIDMSGKRPRIISSKKK
jgi:hypothetical protein